MTRSPSEERLRDEIRRLLLALGNSDARLADHEDAFDAGILQSLNLVELITTLEDRYDVDVTQRDVFEGRLRSVDAIAGFLAAQRSRA